MQKANEHVLLGGLRQAWEKLGRTTGLEINIVDIKQEGIGKPRPDALLDIQIKGQLHRFAIEVKARVDRLAAVGHVKTQLGQYGGKGLLFAPYITAELAKQCRALDLAFLDTAGNAYLNLPDIYVYITGEKPADRTATAMGATGGGTATALRMVFALLCNPKLLNAPYREIVDVAGIALGAVGWVFFDLEGRGYVAGKQRKHNRRFLEPARLFEEWVTNYPIKLRPKLNPRRFKAENPDWWQTTPLHNLGAYWGGEVAADRLTHYLKPATCTVYIKPDRVKDALPRLVADHRLRADPNGNIEILDAFWNLPDDLAHPDVVPPILAYADLVATLDPRNLEAAKMIRKEYIDNAFRQI